MRHPFDGIVVPQEAAPAASRRSVLKVLAGAFAGLFAFKARAAGADPKGVLSLALGEAGGAALTKAFKEEAGDPTKDPTRMRGEDGAATTKAVGEEGGVTTDAIGEEGATTALNEQGGRVTTRALGEEGGKLTRARNEDGGPRATTLAIGEEGGEKQLTQALKEQGGRLPPLDSTAALGEEGGGN